MFKKDDIVVCLRNTDYETTLTVNNTYAVQSVEKEYFGRECHEYLRMKGDNGLNVSAFSSRFRKATQQEIEEYNNQQENVMPKAFADHPYFVMDSSGSIVKYCESYEDATEYARKQAAQVLGKKYHVLERTRSFVGTAVVQEEGV